MAKFHVDRFSVGLDDLSRRDQRDMLKVARVLAKHGRYSVFEATENNTIAGTMDRLMRSGWFEREDIGYPWSRVTLTDAGKRALAEQPEGEERGR